METEKTKLDDLAVFGGKPAFDAPLHVGRPNAGDREQLLRRFGEILDRKWFTNNGPMVQEFERRIRERLGVRHCLAMCNGTIALEIAMRALGMKGEVIVPAFTFIATVHALQWQQIRPVFCDVDPDSHNLDPAQAAALITPRTTGLVGVHLWGQACAVEALAALAARHKLALLFDAAHGFGGSHGGRCIGNFGDAEVFSFHATKFVNAFEGGAVTTNDDALAERVRLMRNFGFSGSYDQVDYVGTNGKMSEISAAMGITSLESMDRFIEINRLHYAAYLRGLGGIAGVTMRRYEGPDAANYQYIVVRIDAAAYGLSRDELVAVLHRENVLARRYFYPGCHRMEPYRTLDPEAGARLPVTEALCAEVLILPTGTGVSDADVQAVCGLIRFAGAHAAAVRARLPAVLGSHTA